jgi:hypothetical protein
MIPTFLGEPMFFLSSPLTFDLLKAFPLLGMPKPLLCDLSLLIAFMCRRGLFPTKRPHHADLNNARHSTLLAAFGFQPIPNQTYCKPRFTCRMQARFSHDIHRLSNYQCRAAIEARKVKEAPVLTSY